VRTGGMLGRTGPASRDFIVRTGDRKIVESVWAGAVASVLCL